jgi:hypothetical protein
VLLKGIVVRRLSLKRYVFLDIQTGKRYEVYAFNALEAKDTVAKQMGIPFWNLKIVERPD